MRICTEKTNFIFDFFSSTVCVISSPVQWGEQSHANPWTSDEKGMQSRPPRTMSATCPAFITLSFVFPGGGGAGADPYPDADAPWPAPRLSAAAGGGWKKPPFWSVSSCFSLPSIEKSDGRLSGVAALRAKPQKEEEVSVVGCEASCEITGNAPPLLDGGSAGVALVQRPPPTPEAITQDTPRVT